MHQGSGSVRETFERDEQADQQHQPASVKVTLAHKVAEKAGGRPQYLLPAVFEAIKSSSPEFLESIELPQMPTVSASDPVSRAFIVPTAARCYRA
jgi:hypothetical protein